MAFQLLGKLVALHLDNNTAKAYLFDQCGTLPPFLSSLACQILHLTNKHIITLIPYTFLPIAMWKPVICHADGYFVSSIFLTLPRQYFSFGVY